MRDYNKKVRHRDFLVANMVLRKTTLNMRNPANGKLGANWEGPYIISGLRKNGTYKLMGYQGKKVPQPWNVENLKKCYP